jgi:hypothetical protein
MWSSVFHCAWDLDTFKHGSPIFLPSLCAPHHWIASGGPDILREAISPPSFIYVRLPRKRDRMPHSFVLHLMRPRARYHVQHGIVACSIVLMVVGSARWDSSWRRSISALWVVCGGMSHELYDSARLPIEEREQPIYGVGDVFIIKLNCPRRLRELK